MGKLTFVSQFLRHPRQISTAFPIQKSLAKKMASEVEGTKVIAEFGPGTGAITKYLVRELPKDGILYCMEINPQFCKELEKIGSPKIHIINDYAQNLYSHVERGSIEGVVSSVPFATMEKSQRDDIIGTAAESELFVPMQCWLPTLAGTLRNYFNDVTSRFVPNHIPPSWYYVCRKNWL